MAEEDYDLVPHKEVLELKKQVDEIKAHPFGSTSEGKQMLEAILKLSESMDRLTSLFQEAAEQMKLEEREAELIGKKLDPLFGRMDDMIEQNKRIAKGIIAVADIVKENSGRPMQRSSPPPIRVEPLSAQPMQRSSFSSDFPPRTTTPPPLPPLGAGPGIAPPMMGPSQQFPPPAKPAGKGFFSFSKK